MIINGLKDEQRDIFVVWGEIFNLKAARIAASKKNKELGFVKSMEDEYIRYRNATIKGKIIIGRKFAKWYFNSFIPITDLE